MAEARAKAFVIMPFGKKKDANGQEIDFDLVYSDVIQEPLERAGLEPLRCDQIEVAGSIHDDMFKHIATADVAIVDITHLNPNVFYELGVRHALKDAITVLIRKRGGAIPFNIQGLRIIEYPSENGSYRESRDQIQRFIENGLRSASRDSPIRKVLERLRTEQREDPSRRIDEQRSWRYQLTVSPPGGVRREIEIRTGDIRKWLGIDVWVSSENTNMQMARFYDRSLSAIIRYHGAHKDENDVIVKDTIADELAEIMKGRKTVELGSVFVTSAGALWDTHGVKNIFHVASVTGVPGEGYRAAPEILDTCVERCLRRMDSLETRSLRSIAFPMMGTGTGGGDVRQVASVLIRSALDYLRNYPASGIEKVIFMAWNRNDLEACQAALTALPDIQALDD